MTEEQQRLLGKWRKQLITPEVMEIGIHNYVEKILEAVRQDQKEKDAEIVQEIHDCIQGGIMNEVLKVIFDETKRKILNPTKQ